MSDEKEKKGFSGLLSLASDVKEATARATHRQTQAEKRATKPQRESSENDTHSSAPETNPTSPQRLEPEVVASGSSRTPTSSSSSGVKWFWGLVGVGILIWLFSAAQEDSAKSSRGHSSAQPGSSPSYMLAPQTQKAGLDFSKPPVGQNNVLSVAQIRWCLREDIRVEFLRSTLTTNAEIDRFNAIIADYNRRCGSYRYRSETLERARNQVTQLRAEIELEIRRERDQFLRGQ